LLNQAWADEFRRRAPAPVGRRGQEMVESEEWQAFGRRVEAHLALIEQEMAALRKTLRGAGIDVRVQRIRITGTNGRANEVLALLRGARDNGVAHVSPAWIARALGVTPVYAFDLLAALVANHQAERIGRGQYKALA
jgi:hypothetical protein